MAEESTVRRPSEVDGARDVVSKAHVIGDFSPPSARTAVVIVHRAPPECSNRDNAPLLEAPKVRELSIYFSRLSHESLIVFTIAPSSKRV